MTTKFKMSALAALALMIFLTIRTGLRTTRCSGPNNNNSNNFNRAFRAFRCSGPNNNLYKNNRFLALPAPGTVGPWHFHAQALTRREQTGVVQLIKQYISVIWKNADLLYIKETYYFKSFLSDTIFREGTYTKTTDKIK